MANVTRLVAALAPLIVGVVLAVLAPSAWAAFPGANGELALLPPQGAGLELVDAYGHNPVQMCTDPSLCGTPTAPHFSRDGRELVFGDRRTGRPVIVAVDGTCLWCLLGPPLTKRTGTGWAFAPNGRVSFDDPKGIWTAPLGPGIAHLAASGAITATAWSPTGAFAFVRGGRVWLRRLGRLARSLGPGGAPTFSPDGKRLAFVRRGWIWTVNVAGGAPRRLVRGSAPAYSPDGRGLAFVGRSLQVYVVGARGGRARAVPGARARAIDWQPLPGPGAGGCSAAAGTTVVAQTAEAVVTYNPANPVTPWSGCLQATGRTTPLVALTPAAGVTTAISQLQVAGRFVAFVLNTTDRYMNCSDAVRALDVGAGAATSLYSQSCTANSRGVDSLAVDSSGFTAWRTHEQVATPQPLTGIACPSSSLCVGSDGHGNVASSTSPATGGSWTLTKVAPALNGIVCPSTTLCLGLDGGAIVTSTDPAGGGAGWNAPVTIDPSAQLADVACPSASLCVAVDNAGNVLTSTNPTGGASAWQLTNVDGTKFLSAISCPSTTLCVAVGEGGDVLTSTHPTAGAPAWTRSSAESVFGLGGVSCPSTTFCLSADSSGNVLTRTNPAASGSWTVHPVPGESSFLYQPVCPSVNLCLVRDGAGNVVVSTNPRAVTPTWTATSLAAPLTGLSCSPGASPLCVAADSAGDGHPSTNPTGGAGAWGSVGVDVPACAPCISEQLYAHDDRATQALDAVQPGPGNVLADVALSANSTVLTWLHAGAGRSYRLK